MVDLGAYRDKFGDSGQRVLEKALGESKRRDQNYITVEHIIHALALEESELFNSTIRSLKIDPNVVTQTIDKRLDNARQHVGKGFRIAPDTTDLFKRAMDRARSHGRKTIESTDIFDVLSKDDSLLVEVLLSLGAKPDAVIEHIKTNVDEREKQEEQYRKKFELPSYLKHFGVSLNRMARIDKIAPTIGREKEIQQIIEILCHRERANSPMLVGEPGVAGPFQLDRWEFVLGLGRVDAGLDEVHRSGASERVGCDRQAGSPVRVARSDGSHVAGQELRDP